MKWKRPSVASWVKSGSGRQIAFLALLVSIWDAVFRFGLYDGYLMPSPQDVLASFARGLSDGSFLIGTAVSLRRIAVGYGISVVLGLGLGLAIGRFRLLEDTVGSLVFGLQTIPSICWLPFAILWFGLSERAIVFVVVMGALLSIVIATDDGVKNTPPLLVRAGRTMGMRGVGLYARVVLPSALPAIVSGMKLGWSFAWRSLMAGELLFVSAGLGQLLTVGRDLNDMSLVIAVMLLIVAVGLAVERLLFGTAERVIRRRWGFVGVRG
ncbi:MAG: ABC transporter permease [Deltaproteobacteria bacterium]|nr:ABC transporter permease [Deltaproteobacteria bacterium]